MQANREGIFHAYPIDVGVNEMGPNKLIAVSIQFSLFEEYKDGDWVDCVSEELEITGFFYLEQKDGGLIEFIIDSLKESFGWDGRDPLWFQETDLSGHPVQIRLTLEEYGGQQRLKAHRLRPYGSAIGGVSKVDDADKARIRNRLSPKLRAAGKASPAPKKAPAGPSASDPQEDPSTSTKDEAWTVFYGHTPSPKWSEEAREEEWYRILNQLFPDKQADELTPAEWARMRDEGPNEIQPF